MLSVRPLADFIAWVFVFVPTLLYYIVGWWHIREELKKWMHVEVAEHAFNRFAEGGLAASMMCIIFGGLVWWFALLELMIGFFPFATSALTLVFFIGMVLVPGFPFVVLVPQYVRVNTFLRQKFP